MKNIDKKTNLMLITKKVVIWLFSVFNLGKERSPSEFYSLLQKLETIRKDRGIAFLVSLLKDTRIVWLNYLAGNSVHINGVRCTKDGIPVILGDLIPKIRKGLDPVLLRLVNTIFFAGRALSLGSKIDLDPIVGPAKQAPNEIGEYILDFWKELGYRKLSTTPRALRWKRFHLTTKVGPNSKGDNALYRALHDLSSLPSSLEASIRTLGGPKFCDVLDTLYNGLVLFKKFNSIIPFGLFGGSIRKLSSIKDKEFKVRVIAIGDYMSQTVLYPLHEYLFNVLRKIPQDCTFGQDKGPQKIKDCGYYCSVDLSNATDRFPISLIESVLSGILPSTYVIAWKDIMVGYPFEYQGQQIKYAVGNPMGFYSSWASFAVAHHYVMYYCCRKLGIDWKTAPYVILGDDVVLGDPRLAELYKSVILSLGVEFSAPKSYTSNHFFEFAKRIFWKGVEISPFPISGLEEVSKKYYLLTQFFIEAEKKGWVTEVGIPAMVQSYYDTVLGLPARFSAKLVKLATVYERVHRIVRGSTEAGRLLSEAFRVLGHQFVLSDFVALNVLENIAVEMFADSNPASHWNEWTKSNKISIYFYDMQLTMAAEDLYQSGIDRAREFIRVMPITDVVRNIHHTFEDLSKEAQGYSNSPGGKWPLLLKAMAFPISKDILVHRSSFLIARTASKIAKSLQNRAEILSFYPPEELLREVP
jgi:hypothetical protein